MSNFRISQTNICRILTEMFRKKVEIEAFQGLISYKDELITVGSCFSDSIGKKLESARFDILVNPFGVIFHPLALSSAMGGLDAENLIERDHYFFNWQLGGTWTDFSEETMREKIVTLNTQFQERFNAANVIMVTFGTAWGYELKESGRVVANCHKMSQDLFEKKLFNSAQILKEWLPIVKNNPDKKWMFTVSPVRHWKDGVRENNVSKGILHQAVHELLKEENVHYFPAYEILLDELRDYRFYQSDHLHPSDEAVDYIWKRFQETYFDQQTTEAIEKVDRLEKARNHKLLFPKSDESRKFLANLERQEEQISQILNKLSS